MKIKMTLYGCANHFGTMTDDRRGLCLQDMKITFGRQFLIAISPKKIPDPAVEVEINHEHVIIPRTYVAEMKLVQAKGERKPGLKTLEKVALELGHLWMEYIRTFIDSGALIAARISTETEQVVWSPHGVVSL
jgi:hypothetical protein